MSTTLSNGSTTLSSKQELDLTPFDTKFCDLKTKVLFEPWATIACVRVMAFIQARKGLPIFSIRGIAIICHLKRSTVANTLETLVEHGYLLKKGNRYYANNRIEVSSGLDTPVQSTGQTVQRAGQSVQFAGHNNQKNNHKEITNRALPKVHKMDWEREDFVPAKETPEEIREMLKKVGL